MEETNIMPFPSTSTLSVPQFFQVFWNLANFLLFYESYKENKPLHNSSWNNIA
jgi:hypothetical protein